MEPSESDIHDDEQLVELKLQIPAHLYRAYQRCTWILIQESEATQLEVMHDMVHDFLVKHSC